MIRHRGPDDEGYALFNIKSGGSSALGGDDTPAFCYDSKTAYSPLGSLKEQQNDSIQLALGHRRLSIVDLSASGHQPMCSSDSRYWIVYNGEVYNYLELREQLLEDGYEFSSQSDTEVIIAAYQKWGRECLSQLNGMFAFLIYDLNKKEVFVARDRFGIKPLYYWVSGAGIAFASEIKQFTVLPEWKAKLNGQRVYDYLNWRVIDHTSETLFDGVFQLRGGEALEISISDVISKKSYCKKNQSLPVYRWYTLQPIQFTGDMGEASQQFRDLLADSVRLRLRSDVSVGSCLSGGLDSSSIVCLMNQVLRDQGIAELQKTFSACSEDKRFDEREYIDEVVKNNRIEANYVYPDLDQLFSEINDIVWHQDEPFVSTSIFAQWNVFKLAFDNKTKVMLDGQGADELMAGYKPYFAARYASLFKHGHWYALLQEARLAKEYHGHSGMLVAQYIAYMLLPISVRQQLLRLSGRENPRPDWINMSALGAIAADPYTELGNRTHSIEALSRSQIESTNLPMLLHWEDRNSMAHSIEARVPFLDFRLVEFLLGLPDQYKISAGTTKRVLRNGMVGVLPDRILNRMDKLGFVTAEEIWMTKRQPEVFKTYISEAIESSNGILNENAKSQSYSIIESQSSFNHLPWRLICFGLWMKKYNLTAA